MKNKSILIQIAFIISLSLILVVPVQARDIKASLGYIPVLSESPEKGILVDLIKAIDEIYTDGKITIDVYPTARSIQNILNGSHDFHLPALRSGMEDEQTLPYAYAGTLWASIFVLYADKNKPDLDMSNLGQYRIETDPNIISVFNFPLQPSASVESSLKKVDMGRIDGYIFSMTETDIVLKQLGLKNIKRINYKAFESPILISKEPKGREVVNILLPLIEQLRDNGNYAKIMGPMLNQKFIEW